MAALNVVFEVIRRARRISQSKKSATVLFVLLLVVSVSVLWNSYFFRGVRIFDPKRADGGDVLIADLHGNSAILMGRQGQIKKKWTVAGDQGWQYANFGPDGNLIVLRTYARAKDGKGGLLFFDAGQQLNSEINIRAHHDFTIREDGHLFVLANRDEVRPDLGNKALQREYVAEFGPAHELLSEWQLLDHVAELNRILPNSPFIIGKSESHLNSFQILPPTELGRTDARFKSGNWLLSSRDTSTIFIVDQPSGKIVWAFGPGTFEGQHDARMQPDGEITVFDNGSNRGWSRAIRLDPRKGTILWSHPTVPEKSFYSAIRGSSEWLPNGNVLITLADMGRVVEVTREHDIVWDFLQPMRPFLDVTSTMAITRVPFYRTKRVGAL